MRDGLYRLVLKGVGECVRTRCHLGDAYPYLDRETYEALGFEPAFEELPTKCAYLSERGTRTVYISPIEAALSAGQDVSASQNWQEDAKSEDCQCQAQTCGANSTQYSLRSQAHAFLAQDLTDRSDKLIGRLLP